MKYKIVGVKTHYRQYKQGNSYWLYLVSDKGENLSGHYVFEFVQEEMFFFHKQNLNKKLGYFHIKIPMKNIKDKIIKNYTVR